MFYDSFTHASPMGTNRNYVIHSYYHLLLLTTIIVVIINIGMCSGLFKFIWPSSKSVMCLSVLYKSIIRDYRYCNVDVNHVVKF